MEKRFVVTVVAKDIRSEKGNFVNYSLLSSKGNWYRTAKAEPKVLEQFAGKVATVIVSRKFNKIVNVRGEEREYPTLVIEAIENPSAQELKKYQDELGALNSKTLEDLE